MLRRLDAKSSFSVHWRNVAPQPDFLDCDAKVRQLWRRAKDFREKTWMGKCSGF